MTNTSKKCKLWFDKPDLSCLLWETVVCESTARSVGSLLDYVTHVCSCSTDKEYTPRGMRTW